MREKCAGVAARSVVSSTVPFPPLLTHTTAQASAQGKTYAVKRGGAGRKNALIRMVCRFIIPSNAYAQKGKCRCSVVGMAQQNVIYGMP